MPTSKQMSAEEIVAEFCQYSAFYSLPAYPYVRVTGQDTNGIHHEARAENMEEIIRAALASYAAYLAGRMPIVGYLKPVKAKLGEAIMSNDVSLALHLAKHMIHDERVHVLDGVQAVFAEEIGKLSE